MICTSLKESSINTFFILAFDKYLGQWRQNNILQEMPWIHYCTLLIEQWLFRNVRLDQHQLMKANEVHSTSSQKWVKGGLWLDTCRHFLLCLSQCVKIKPFEHLSRRRHAYSFQSLKLGRQLCMLFTRAWKSHLETAM